MHLLFVCSKNLLRSPTAEAVFNEYTGIEAISAGTNADSPTPLSGDLIEWADVVLVMEKSHRRKVAERYAALLKQSRLVCLDIPDNYRYMQPELVGLLRRRVSACIELD